MNQKRVQGSHFANLKQASAANQLMLERRLDPCMSEVFPWAQIPQAHVKMRRNEHKPGNMAVLVSAPRTGLRTLADTVEAELRTWPATLEVGAGPGKWRRISRSGLSDGPRSVSILWQQRPHHFRGYQYWRI